MERFYFPKRQHYLRKSNRMAFDIFEKLASLVLPFLKKNVSNQYYALLSINNIEYNLA